MKYTYSQIFALFLFSTTLAMDTPAKPDLLDKYKDPQRGLCAAIRSNRLDKIEHFIRAGANVDGTTSEGSVPLGVALTSKDIQVGIVQALLRHGAQPNGNYNDSPLIWHAVRSERTELVDALLEHGVDLRTIDRPIVYRAVETKNIAIVKALHNACADIDKPDYNTTPLEFAVMLESFDMARYLLSVKAHYDPTLLYWAVKAGNPSFIQEVLELEGIDVEAKSSGKTALQVALESFSPRNKTLKAVAAILLNRGAQPNAPDLYPLHRVVKTYPYSDSGQREDAISIIMDSLNLFLSHRASLHTTDHKGNTALHIAAENRHTPFLVERLLQEPGIDVNALNNEQHSALALLIKENDENVSLVSDFLQRGTNPNQGPVQKRPLYYALLYNRQQTIDTLMAHGGNITEIAKDDETMAQFFRIHRLSRAPTEVQTIRHLLQAGAKPNLIIKLPEQLQTKEFSKVPLLISAIAYDEEALIDLLFEFTDLNNLTTADKKVFNPFLYLFYKIYKLNKKIENESSWGWSDALHKKEDIRASRSVRILKKLIDHDPEAFEKAYEQQRKEDHKHLNDYCGVINHILSSDPDYAFLVR